MGNLTTTVSYDCDPPFESAQPYFDGGKEDFGCPEKRRRRGRKSALPGQIQRNKANPEQTRPEQRRQTLRGHSRGGGTEQHQGSFSDWNTKPRFPTHSTRADPTVEASGYARGLRCLATG